MQFSHGHGPVAPSTTGLRCLVVPQWQGWAVSAEQRDGAFELARRFAAFRPEEAITPAPWQALELEGQILGRSAVLANLERIRASLAQRPARHLFTLGGDCSVDIAPISAMNKAYAGDLAIVWLDAHGDLNSPDESTSHRFHGMPIRALLGDCDPMILAAIDAPLKRDQVFLAGARDLDPPESDFIRSTGLSSLSVEELRANPRALAAAIRRGGYRHVHLHLDFDVLDPAHFSELNTPVAGGFSVPELLQVVEALTQQLNVVSATLTEYSPISGAGLGAVEPILAFFAQEAHGWSTDTELAIAA